MRPVRVLHVIDSLGGGGSERWIYDTVRLSDPRRVLHRVSAVHPDLGQFVYAARLRQLGAYATGRAKSTTTEAPNDRGYARMTRLSRGRAVEPLLRALWRGAVMVPGAYRAMRELRRFRPDVIHGHTSLGFVVAVGLAAVARRPVVHTVPATFSQMSDAAFGWMPGFYRRSHPHVARFFTAYPDELRGLRVPESKVTQIHGVVDVDQVEAARRQRDRHRLRIREIIGVAPAAPIALSVGRLHPSKGHDLGAEAIAVATERVPELHWIVLGEGPGQVSLESRIRSLGLRHRSHLLGFVSDVLPYYAAADAYLRTNVLEGENQSSYQAMAIGLPIVGFDTGAPTELLHKVGHGVLVAPGDAAALGEALAGILTSDERSAAFGERGRVYARAELGIAQTIESFTATYEQLAGAKPHASGA